MESRGDKILMLIPSFYPNRMGGSELQALKLAKLLVAQGNEVNVLTLKNKNLQANETVEGINVYRISGFLLQIPRIIQFIHTKIPFLQKKINKNFLKEYGKPNGIAEYFMARMFYLLCYRAIKKNNIEFSLIQINTVEWLSITGAQLAKTFMTPLIIKDSTVNGLSKLKFMPFSNKYRRWIIENAFFVAVSSAIKNNMTAEGVEGKRIFRVNNGVEVTEAAHFQKNFTPNSCLFVGNLYQEPAKGFQILLFAWQKVIAIVQDAMLNVVGDGNIDAYKHIVASLNLQNNICFWGKQVDMKRFYLSNEIFVLPSIREGMSNALMEAMIYGLPCISTKVSGSTDLIVDKVSGVLIEPGDATELADAVLFLFANKNLHEQMGQKARERAKELCNFKSISYQYTELYKTVTTS